MTANLTAGAMFARIDVSEGPNLEGLVKPWLILTHSEEGLPEWIESISLRFDEVALFDEKGKQLDPRVVGQTLTPRLLSLEVLGGDIKSAKNGDFVIKVEFGGSTFQGHYNTNKRKGSLVLVK